MSLHPCVVCTLQVPHVAQCLRTSTVWSLLLGIAELNTFVLLQYLIVETIECCESTRVADRFVPILEQ